MRKTSVPKWEIDSNTMERRRSETYWNIWRDKRSPDRCIYQNKIAVPLNIDLATVQHPAESTPAVTLPLLDQLTDEWRKGRSMKLQAGRTALSNSGIERASYACSFVLQAL